MHISMNELKSALQRCFQASEYFVGNYEDASNMVLWLEKHGLDGLQELLNALPYIKIDSDKPLSTVIYEDKTSAVINSHGRSALNCIAAAVDLAHAKALETGIATITVHNCHNRKFILKALTDCGRRGISVVAYWKNQGSSVTEHTAAIKANARYPSYSQALTNLHTDGDDLQSLTIVCSSRVDLTSSLQNSYGNRKAYHISARQVEENKTQSVNQGIDITEALWEDINRIGAGILVENSLLSSLGAG
ncbi:DUF3726 domain-containing protein [Marinomonas sp. A79]|uniref:DUF3726 domain-containing protein n=1 Tax=Marinomonas vulgaris TaxID=2823372 RepID=A0ABS5H7F6_9GAMM|nr:DUF3726 domain-containing protein [Marinomonas vulgaris]MBR7887480.1 DUF3726 domain-containing protein [Marinomonas vulgaris]